MPAIVRLPFWFLPLMMALAIGLRRGYHAADSTDTRRARTPLWLLVCYIGWAAVAGAVQGDIVRGAASIVLSPVLFMQMVASMLATTAAGFGIGFGIRLRFHPPPDRL